jgi:hypothetical protein
VKTIKLRRLNRAMTRRQIHHSNLDALRSHSSSPKLSKYLTFPVQGMLISIALTNATTRQHSGANEIAWSDGESSECEPSTMT